MEIVSGAAMQQIKDKDYAKPFKLDGRKIVLVGANFALDMSALEGVLVESYTKVKEI